MKGDIVIKHYFPNTIVGVGEIGDISILTRKYYYDINRKRSEQQAILNATKDIFEKVSKFLEKQSYQDVIDLELRISTKEISVKDLY